MNPMPPAETLTLHSGESPLLVTPLPHSETSAGQGDTLVLGGDPVFGLCVRSLTGFASGDVLDRFSGTIGPQITQHSLQVSAGRHISGTRFVGFLSHACAPNCRLDMERFELIALCDIAPFELLTIDYAATEDTLFRQFACHCGAASCRGWITGKLDTPGRPAGSIIPSPASAR